MAAPIRLYLAFASPYAYFAIDAADRLAATRDRTVEWRPILVWALLKAHGIAPPMDPPARRAYFLTDIARSPEYHGVLFREPTPFPLSSHPAARLYHHMLSERGPALARAVGQSVFTAYFSEQADISDQATLTAIAARHGVGEAAAREAIAGEIGRRGLAEAIDAATAEGVCGSPYFILDGEPFFGADRLPQLAWRLSRGSRSA